MTAQVLISECSSKASALDTGGCRESASEQNKSGRGSTSGAKRELELKCSLRFQRRSLTQNPTTHTDSCYSAESGTLMRSESDPIRILVVDDHPVLREGIA